MAPELTICTSTTDAAENDDERVRLMTPNTSYSCTPDSSTAAAIAAIAAAAAETSSTMVYTNPWSSQNSPTANNNTPTRGSHRRNPNNPKTNIPIITPKSREALRNLSCGGGRDQEDSVDEEIWQLKRALLDKDMELRRRKVHTANVEAENSKLAKDMEALEQNSNGRGGRTWSPRKLRAKLAGMKVMLEEAYNTCELQSVELYNLRRDVGLTHARELEVERNVYATEVRRLQEVVKKLKLANGRIGHENRMIGRLKAKNHHLEVMNLRLSSCLSASLSQTPTTPRTPRTQLPQRDALVRNSFSGFDNIHQQQALVFVGTGYEANPRMSAVCSAIQAFLRFGFIGIGLLQSRIFLEPGWLPVG